MSLAKPAASLLPLRPLIQLVLMTRDTLAEVSDADSSRKAAIEKGTVGETGTNRAAECPA
jgi:hypothetical protein